MSFCNMFGDTLLPGALRRIRLPLFVASVWPRRAYSGRPCLGRTACQALAGSLFHAGAGRRAERQALAHQLGDLAVSGGIGFGVCRQNHADFGSSGLWAWGILAHGLFPFNDPFDVNLEMVGAFAQQFRNPDTLREYLGHVRLILRVLGREPSIPIFRWNQLLRGARKDKRRAELPRLRQREVILLVQAAMQNGWFDLARLFVVARGFLCRVANELIPLQADGLSSDERAATPWHSKVHVQGSRVEVTLRSRKNMPQGAKLIRQCSCKSTLDILCCACALARQLQVASAQDSRPNVAIWPFNLHEATQKFRACCETARIEWPGWHSFRRGMASDMLDKGSPLSLVLRAGGWRSGAFLTYLTKSALDRREAVEFTMRDSDSEKNT